MEQGGIKPNGSYPVNQIWHTLRTGLGKNPHIDCYYESVSFIFEIFITNNNSSYYLFSVPTHPILMKCVFVLTNHYH